MPTGHDPTRIYKSPITPKKGQKLGASATWSKLKYQSHQYTSKITQSSIAVNNNPNKIIEFGINGEVFIAYTNSNIIEVWDWKPSALELNELETKPESNGHTSKDGLLNQLNNNETLYLVASILNIKGVIININPIICDQVSNTYTILITSIVSNETNFTLKTFGQVFKEDFKENSLILPPCVHGLNPFTIKNSENFIGIATNEGSLTIFDIEKNHPLSLALDCAIIQDQVMFTISGRYLAYVPNSIESLDLNKTFMNYTPNSNEHSIYSKILNNLSKSAMDGVLKISDINTIQQNLQTLLNSQNLKNNIKLYLSNILTNGFQKNHGQYVIIYDLIKESQIGCFQPSDGISQLSLSPYNSQLITISSRGDQISNWDLSKLSNEISLLDIQIRGKTSSIVDYIHWSKHNQFQIITRSSGSIHNLNSNLDHDLNSEDDGNNNWILSNMQVSKISKIDDSNRWLLGYSPTNETIFLIDSWFGGSIGFEFKLPLSGIPKSLLPNHIKLDLVDEKCLRLDEDDETTLTETSTQDFINDFPLSQIEIESSYITSPLYQSKQITMGHYSLKHTPSDYLDQRHEYNDIDVELSDKDGHYENFKKVYSIMGNPVGFKRIDDDKGKGDVFFHEKLENGMDGLNEALNDVLILNEDVK